MSSEIVTASQLPAMPVPWRMVSAAVAALRAPRPSADQQAASVLDQARREAFSQGLSAGRQQADEQIRPAMEGLAQALAELGQLRSAIREQETENLVRLAVSIAARVIHREVVIDPDALAGLVQAAFTKAQSREISRVRMHPALEGKVRKSLEQCGAPKNLLLAADPRLKSGEVLFETPQGILDASVETQLSEIERGLIDQLER